MTLGGPEDVALAGEIDDDATALYLCHGLPMTLPPGHPYLEAEARCWRRCAEAGGLWFARRGERAVGVLVFDHKDGVRYIEQLSVRTEAQGRGVGRALLAHAQSIAAAEGLPIFLTTYDHLPWNAPFYARHGFVRVPEDARGPGLRSTLDAERAALPAPEHRTAMRWRP